MKPREAATIAGYNPDSLPNEVTREYDQKLGEYRQKVVGRFATNMLDKIASNPELLKNKEWKERTQKTIQALDTQAARLAKADIDRKAKAPAKLPKKPTVRELRGARE